MSKLNVPEQGYFTVHITVVYDDNSEDFYNELKEIIETKYPLVELIGFHENKLRERSNAFKTKGGWSARLNPFAIAIDNERKPIKAFYSEAKQCTVDNITKCLDSFINYNSNENESTSSKNNA